MSRKAKGILVFDENKHNHSIKQPIGGVMMGRKFGGEILPKRRPLSVINHNHGEAADPHFCCVANKRGLAEENGSLAANRAVTRKCTAQLGSSQQKYPEEAKKAKTSANEFTVWEGIPLTEPEPMSLERSEVAATESSQTEEVEMEDIFEETIIDIDVEDCKDPLAVVDYIEDLYAYYKSIESSSCASSVYMVNQFDINERMRAILIDWLVEVHHKFELREETLFLTVNLIDRFLANQSVARKKLQLVGLVAMLLACKYEEVSVPVVDDLIFISDKAYTRKEILEMEKLMLNTLQFNMSVPTPYVFMRRFLKAAQSDQKLEQLAFFLIELCLVEYEMLKHPPSFLAAGAVYTAQLTLHGDGQWSKTCERHTGYSEDQLQECSREMIQFHEKAESGKLTGVHRKYNTQKFGYAARCEPARFHSRKETNAQISSSSS